MVGHTNLQSGYQFAIEQVQAAVTDTAITVSFTATGDHPGDYVVEGERFGNEVLGSWRQSDGDSDGASEGATGRQGLALGHVGSGPAKPLSDIPAVTPTEVALPSAVDMTPFEPLAEPVPDHLGITDMASI